MSDVSPSFRIARRRATQRERILAVAARRFAEVGADGVRLDQVADEVDLARNTLYSHFATKDQLVEAIVAPALEQGVAALRKLARARPRQRIDGILQLYLTLWERHGDALRIAYRLRRVPSGRLAELHGAFADGVLAALKSAAKAGILRVREPPIAARVVMRVAIPLLELYAGYPDSQRLFLESMRGLLVVDMPAEASGRGGAVQRGTGRSRVGRARRAT